MQKKRYNTLNKHSERRCDETNTKKGGEKKETNFLKTLQWMVKCVCLPSIMIFSMFRAIRLRVKKKYIRFCVDFYRNIQVLPERKTFNCV
jgi:hypothetical protein